MNIDVCRPVTLFRLAAAGLLAAAAMAQTTGGVFRGEVRDASDAVELSPWVVMGTSSASRPDAFATAAAICPVWAIASALPLVPMRIAVPVTVPPPQAQA